MWGRSDDIDRKYAMSKDVYTRTGENQFVFRAHYHQEGMAVFMATQFEERYPDQEVWVVDCQCSEAQREGFKQAVQDVYTTATIYDFIHNPRRKPRGQTTAHRKNLEQREVYDYYMQGSIRNTLPMSMWASVENTGNDLYHYIYGDY